MMSRAEFAGVVCGTFLSVHSPLCAPQNPVSAAADAASGELAFNNACRTCHTINKDDNRLGPNLYQIIGRTAGSAPNYAYSSAMAGADFVWDQEKLDRFIQNPDAVVPGNAMKPYGGMASADTRAKVIAFLRSLASVRSP